MSHIFKKQFYSDIYTVRDIVLDLQVFVKCSIPRLTNDDMFDLKLIFSELLLNAVIHGNNSDANKSVFLTVEISNKDITASITDEGSGFDYAKLIGDFSRDDDLENEHGRGIRLAYSLSDKMTFNSSGNEIRITKRFEANE